MLKYKNNIITSVFHTVKHTQYYMRIINIYGSNTYYLHIVITLVCDKIYKTNIEGDLTFK